MRTFELPSDVLATIDKRLAAIESLLQQFVPAQAQSRLRLNDTEQRILAMLAIKPLKGKAIAGRLGCDLNSSLRTTLSVLVRSGVLGNGRNGYFVAPTSGDVGIAKVDEEPHDATTRRERHKHGFLSEK